MAEKEKEQRKKEWLVQNEREIKNVEEWWTNSLKELNLTQLTSMKHALEDLKKEVNERASLFHQSNSNFYVGSSSNAAAPEAVNGGNISINQGFFPQNGMPTHVQTLPFGFNVMNRTPTGYNNCQIQNQEFKQVHPYYGPRYY